MTMRKEMPKIGERKREAGERERERDRERERERERRLNMQRPRAAKARPHALSSLCHMRYAIYHAAQKKTKKNAPSMLTAMPNGGS